MDGKPSLQSWMLSGTGEYGALVVVVGLLLFPAQVLRADEIYKSVDSQGHVVYSDRIDSSTHQQTIVVGDPQTPPDQIHFCWTNCFTLVFDNGVYTRTDGTEETWTVQHFNSYSVLLMRHDAPTDWNGFSQDVPYEGQVDHGRLTHIKVAGKPVSGMDMAWGIALNTLPGTNAERDQLHSALPNAAGATQPPATAEQGIDADLRTTTAPPPLPNEEQPPVAAAGDIWTPGYWNWGGGEYFWSPGVWVEPPRAGVLWTPGYWEFIGTVYAFHRGYWGPRVGYYGGINYGFGYGGEGYVGGRWVGNAFAYNRAVNNVNVTLIHNSYSEPVSSNTPVGRASFHSGPPVTAARGIASTARPSASPSASAQPRVAEARPSTAERPPKTNAATPPPKITRAITTKPAHQPKP